MQWWHLLVCLRARIVILLTTHSIGLDQGGIAIGQLPGTACSRFGLIQGRLGLCILRLIGSGINPEEHLPFLYFTALLEFNFLHDAIHPCAHLRIAHSADSSRKRRKDGGGCFS